MGIFHDQYEQQYEQNGDDNELYLGNAIDCIPFMRNNKVDELFCAMPGVSKENVDLLMDEADRNLTRFRLVPDYYEYFPGTASIEMIDNIPVITGRAEPLENIQNALLKDSSISAFPFFRDHFCIKLAVPDHSLTDQNGVKRPCII